MSGIKIGGNRLISLLLSIVMCLTVLTGTIWALTGLFKVGMNIEVSYDPLVEAKVYLSTDSAGAGSLQQPSSKPGNTVTVQNFSRANSALVCNTHDNSNSGAQSKTDFEALTSLDCNASGEIKFYVLVENYSTKDNVYYKVDVSFNGEIPENGIRPFSAIENPSGAVSEAVSVMRAISFAMVSGSPTSGYVPWPAANRPRIVRSASSGNDFACRPCSAIRLSTAPQSACSSA